MSSLRANLKLYSPFQKNQFITILYILQFVFFLLVFFYHEENPWVIRTIQGGRYPFSLMLPFFGSMIILGFMVTAIQIDILIKPLSYCLPGHEKTSKRLTFIIGITNAVFYFIFYMLLPFPYFGIMYTVYSLLLSFSGLAFYFLAVLLSYRMKQVKPNAQVKYLFLPFPLYFFIFYEFIISDTYSYSFKEYIIFCFIPLCVSTVIGISLVRKTLDDPSLKKNYCTKYLMTFFHKNTGYIRDAFAFQADQKTSFKINKLTQCLMKEMLKKSYLSLKRSILGELYYLFDKVGIAFKGTGNKFGFTAMFALITLCYIFSGYKANDHEILSKLIPAIQYFIVFMISISAATLITSFKHDIILPTGRHLNFKTHYIIYFLRSLLLITWTFSSFIISWFLNYFLPDLTIMGYNFTYSTIDIYTVFMPFVFIPAWDLCMLDLLKEISYFRSSFSLLTKLVYFFTLYLLCLALILDKYYGPPIILFISMLIISNGVFIVLFFQHWFKNDIV